MRALTSAPLSYSCCPSLLLTYMLSPAENTGIAQPQKKDDGLSWIQKVGRVLWW